jgi:hypothetical protein
MSGFGWNEETGCVTAPPHVWDQYLQVFTILFVPHMKIVDSCMHTALSQCKVLP